VSEGAGGVLCTFGFIFDRSFEASIVRDLTFFRRFLYRLGCVAYIYGVFNARDKEFIYTLTNMEDMSRTVSQGGNILIVVLSFTKQYTF
jgi:hypothetical protein